MNDIMSGHDEIRELLGVYALDALARDEHDAVARHLAGCAECRAEVADHLEVAADLSALTTATPPSGLWERIADELDPEPGERTAQELPPLRLVGDRDLTSGRGRQARGDGRRRWIMLASVASVAAAIIAVLAIGLVRANQRAGDAEAALARPAIELAADQALHDPANRRLELRTPAGEVTAVAVVTPAGEGYFVPHAMHSLPADRTYQLWQIGATGPVSLGVFGNEPGVRGFHLQGAVQTLAVTDEAAGGRALPEGAPLATATA